MAVGIDNVYQQVLAIANKEQRGYITPQEFNLFARKAQQDIFNKTFEDYKDAFLHPMSVSESDKDLDMLREKLDHFRFQAQNLDMSGGTGSPAYHTVGTIPSATTGVLWIESVYSLSNNLTFEEIDKKRLTFLKKYQAQHTFPLNVDEAIYDSSGNLAFTSINTYYREKTDTLVFFPAPTTIPAAANSTVTDVVPQIDYVKSLSAYDDPKWAFTVVAGKALFDDTNKKDFVIHESEEASLVNKILELAGISLMKPDLIQGALQNEKFQQQPPRQPKPFIDTVDNSRTGFEEGTLPYGKRGMGQMRGR
tara:strand:- start:11663 stop:12583 length:921 start_codon:yes stop_codon:yes gene_type:complete